MKKIFTLAFFLISIDNSFAQQITFQKLINGASFAFGYSVRQTTDGGYIIGGYTSSFTSGGDDVYLIKTDADGDSLWTRTFGGTGTERGNSVQQTADGGYIIAGYTDSFGAGDEDVYLIKTDANGDTLWTKTYGNTGTERCSSVQQTSDGGYIITGQTSATVAGSLEVYLIRTDANGDMLWVKTFTGGVGSGYGVGYCVIQTADGGYIVSGSVGDGGGASDAYLIKTDGNGDTLWTKAFGGAGTEDGRSVQQTSDGGYIITGSTNSFGAGQNDAYLVKTDSGGNLLWAKTFGEWDDDVALSARQTTDGGFIVSGLTQNFFGFHWGIYLIKTNVNGNLLWTKLFGGIGGSNNYSYSVRQTTDGGYILSGTSNGFTGTGIYLIKTDSFGNSGCNQGNTTTITGTPLTQFTNPATIIAPPAVIVSSPATVVGSGGTVTTLCTTVGIQSAITNLQSAITISPNPTFGNFIITFSNTIHTGIIEIYTVLGERIMEENIINTSQKEIHLNNIPAGIYFVKVVADEKQNTQKLVVQ